MEKMFIFHAQVLLGVSQRLRNRQSAWESDFDVFDRTFSWAD